MNEEQIKDALLKLVLGRKDSIEELAQYLASLKAPEAKKTKAKGAE